MQQSELRIYASYVRADRLRMRRDAEAPHEPSVSTSIEDVEPVTMDPHEVETLAILEQPAHGETIETTFRRREGELLQLFSTLSPVECGRLYARLSCQRQGDRLAEAFCRMSLERRQRLAAFLANARRREAHATSRTGMR